MSFWLHVILLLPNPGCVCLDTGPPLNRLSNREPSSVELLYRHYNLKSSNDVKLKFVSLYEVDTGLSLFVLWPDRLTRVRDLRRGETISTIDCINNGGNFWVFKVKPTPKCLKPAFFPLSSRGRLHQFQKEVWLNVSLRDKDTSSHLIYHVS